MAREHWFKAPAKHSRDDLVTFCSRVNAVGQIQLWFSTPPPPALQKNGMKARMDAFWARLREDGL